MAELTVIAVGAAAEKSSPAKAKMSLKGVCAIVECNS